jgi:hypothetical protein
MAFALDTGRLFIGPSGEEGQAGFPDRTASPGDNIEVLTEASLETFARLFDRMNRLAGPTAMATGAIDRKPFVEADLAITGSTWTALTIKEVLPDGTYSVGSTIPLVLTDTDSGGAQIRYFLFAADEARRGGIMELVDQGSSIQFHDEYTSIDHTNQALVRFRAAKDSSNRLTIEYQNTTIDTYRLQMQIVVAARRT